MKLEEIRTSIQELARETEMMQEELQKAMVEVIYESSKENPTTFKKVSDHIMTISLSEISGKPWSPKFFDWEESAREVLKYLKGTPITGWKKKLEDLLQQSDRDVIELKKRGTIWPGMTGIIQRTPIDRRFIEKIMEKI